MKHNLLGRMLCAASTGAFGLLAFAGSAQAAAFTPGNLVVMRIGDGTAALGSGSTACFLDEYTTAGVFVQSIPMPIAAAGLNFPLTTSGTATSEGFLTLSSNGQYLVNCGYGVAPGVATIAATTSTVANRVVGRIDMAGNIDTTTAFSDMTYSAGNPRSACSDNGLQFWTTGPSTITPANGGLRYSLLGATTSTQVSISVTNLRVVDIAGTDMFVSSASGTTQGVCSIVPALPTTPGAVINILPGFPTAAGPSAYDFFVADPNIIFVADDRASASAGGIQRWDNISGTWTIQYTVGLSATVGCRGLTGVVNAGTVRLYATTHQTSLNQIVTMSDTLVVGTPTPSTLIALPTPAVAPTNTGFRGIRLLPAAPSTPSVAYCSGDGTDTACPCSNPGAAGRGCENTFATGGASIAASGLASIGADTLVMTATTAIPFGPGLYYEGSAPANAVAPFGVAFGNGLRCAGGNTHRLEIRFADSVGASNTTVSLAAFGAASAGATYYYQLWYRDTGNVGSCTPGAGFNFSNARALTWIP